MYDTIITYICVYTYKHISEYMCTFINTYAEMFRVVRVCICASNAMIFYTYLYTYIHLYQYIS